MSVTSLSCITEFVASRSTSILACGLFACCVFACCIFAYCIFAHRILACCLLACCLCLEGVPPCCYVLGDSLFWRVGPHSYLPSGPPFSKHLRPPWSSIIFGGDPWEVAMVTPLFAFCPHLLITCFALNWHLPSIFDYCLSTS